MPTRLPPTMSDSTLSPTMAAWPGSRPRRASAMRNSGGSGLPTTSGLTPEAALTAATMAPQPGRKSPTATSSWPASVTTSASSGAPMTSTRERPKRSAITCPRISSGVSVCSTHGSPLARRQSPSVRGSPLELGDGVGVHLLGPLGHGGPRELLFHAPPSRPAHVTSECRIAEQARDRGRQHVRLRRLHEHAGLAVLDDFQDAAHRGGHHRRLAGHRLQVDEAEGLVDR